MKRILSFISVGVACAIFSVNMYGSLRETKISGSDVSNFITAAKEYFIKKISS